MEEINRIESETKKLQEQRNEVETYICSLIDGADEFTWVFEDERVSYRKRLEQNRQAIRLDNVELTAELLEHSRQMVDDERKSLKSLCEQREAWIQHWLVISSQLTDKGQYLSRFAQSVEGYVRELELNRWDPKGFLAVIQMNDHVNFLFFWITDGLTDEMPEPESPVATRTIPPILAHSVEHVKYSAGELSDEIRQETGSLVTLLKKVNKKVLYQLRFEPAHDLQAEFLEVMEFEYFSRSVNELVADENRLHEKIEAVKNLSPQLKWHEAFCHFEKCWRRIAEPCDGEHINETIKQRIQDLEEAIVRLQTTDYEFEESTLPSMDSSVSEAYQAARQHRNQTLDFLKDISSHLDEDFWTILGWYGERCTAPVSCSFNFTAEQLDKIKKLLENIKSIQESYMRLVEDVKSALSTYAADLPGYQSLTQ